MIQKALAFGITFLLIAITMTPSNNFIVVKASNANDVVEITTHACGIQGYRNTTVKLTRQQYKNLEQYFVYFQARLNETTTKGEVALLFKQVVLELNKYGLLPNGMNVKQAQKLVSGELFLWKKILFSSNKNIEIPYDVLNLCCYLYTHTQYSFEDNIWVLLASAFGHLDFKYDLKIFDFLNSLFFECSQLKPCRFMNKIWVAGPGIGGITYSYYTLGLLGIKKGSDDFDTAYGFSGIKINLDYSQIEAIYIGFSLVVT